jgi:hypothetical protein
MEAAIAAIFADGGVRSRKPMTRDIRQRMR